MESRDVCEGRRRLGRKRVSGGKGGKRDNTGQISNVMAHDIVQWPALVLCGRSVPFRTVNDSDDATGRRPPFFPFNNKCCKLSCQDP